MDECKGSSEPLIEEKEATVEHVSSELEDILLDARLSHFQRLRRASAVEFSNLFRLAAPAIIVYLLNNVTSVSTQIFCGHLGNLELAAASLGNEGIQLLAYGVMVRFVSTLFVLALLRITFYVC